MPERHPEAANGSEERVFRYRLVIETDEYSVLSALNELAEAALGRNSARTWTVRVDEEVRRV